MVKTSLILLVTIISTLLQAAPATAGGEAVRQPFMPTLMFFGFLFLLFYVLFIAPQRKQQRQQEAVLKALKPGDRVVTKGGIKGIVSSARPEIEYLLLKVADNVKVEILRGSIDRKLEEEIPQ